MRLPVYDTVFEAMRRSRRRPILYPCPLARDAAYEAIDAGIKLLVITEGIPLHDFDIMDYAHREGR